MGNDTLILKVLWRKKLRYYFPGYWLLGFWQEIRISFQTENYNLMFKVENKKEKTYKEE